MYFQIGTSTDDVTKTHLRAYSSSPTPSPCKYACYAASLVAGRLLSLRLAARGKTQRISDRSLGTSDRIKMASVARAYVLDKKR